MVEVHVLTGWRKFPNANAYAIGDDGTLRLIEVGPAPEYGFKRWIALFAPGGWQGLTTDEAEERPELGFRPRREFGAPRTHPGQGRVAL